MTTLAISEATANREALILDKPPRILAVNSEANLEAALEHLAKLRSGSTGPTIIPEMLVTLMGCHADLYEKVAAVSVHLLRNGSLPRRDLELVVLRTDWLCQSPYNWGEHVKIAKRYGITSEEIELTIVGSTAKYWSEHERALIKAAEELHFSAMISDETWEILAKSFNEQQLYELIVLVGQFTLVTYFQNSLRLRLPSDNEGLCAR